MYSFQNQNNNINMNLGNDQIDINTQIKLILQKISKLEDSNYNLSQLLNDETSQRQILEKHSTTSIDAFYGQLNILKNNYEKLENAFKENLSKMKGDVQPNNQKKENKNKDKSEEIIKKEFEQYQKELNKIDNLENKINLINKENKKNIKEINDKIDILTNDIKPLKDINKKNKSNFQKLKEEFQQNLNDNQNFLNEVNNKCFL